MQRKYAKKAELQICNTIPCVEAWSKAKQMKQLEECRTQPFYQGKPRAATIVLHQGENKGMRRGKNQQLLPSQV